MVCSILTIHDAFYENDNVLFRIDNLTTMTDRIKEMREALYTKLKAKGTPGTWEHIITHIGMFTFSGLTG